MTIRGMQATGTNSTEFYYLSNSEINWCSARHLPKQGLSWTPILVFELLAQPFDKVVEFSEIGADSDT